MWTLRFKQRKYDYGISVAETFFTDTCISVAVTFYTGTCIGMTDVKAQLLTLLHLQAMKPKFMDNHVNNAENIPRTGL